jgi:hypothetical protein
VSCRYASCVYKNFYRSGEISRGGEEGAALTISALPLRLPAVADEIRMASRPRVPMGARILPSWLLSPARPTKRMLVSQLPQARISLATELSSEVLCSTPGVNYQTLGSANVPWIHRAIPSPPRRVISETR